MGIFLGGKTNFRTDIATIKEYKGGRDRKPIHYAAIRNYLVEVHDAEVIEGMEADDALGIYQTSDSCICTIDKDLDMVEGYHYNFVTDKMYTITPGVALRKFYTQLLTGDPVDCIVGVPLIGKVKAAKILSKCADEEDMFWAALEQYNLKYPRPLEALIENGQLLFILREPEVMWDVPA
jgi:5'-3' exonuclease